MPDTTLNFVEGEGISIQTGPNPADDTIVDIEIATTLEIPDPVTADPADDTQVWLPLTTTVAGDDVLVYDADHSLIPTLIPL